jgi:hypothetical protein
LTVAQFIALSWYAISDPAIFTSDRDRADRQQGLLESFATIQRAHNDNGLGGGILWDWDPESRTPYRHIAEDRPSCELGTFKRIIEHLDHIHPDVTLNPAIPIPSADEIVRDIRNQHHLIFMPYYQALTVADRNDLVNLAGAYEAAIEARPAYIAYLAQLRTAVHLFSPSIPQHLLEANTDRMMLCALMNESLQAE